MPEIPKTIESWLPCLTLPEYLALIPDGKRMTLGSPVIWTDGNGKDMTTEEYIKVHGVDPQLVWDAKKEYLKRMGQGVHVG
jgi:hypothetical protein